MVVRQLLLHKFNKQVKRTGSRLCAIQNMNWRIIHYGPGNRLLLLCLGGGRQRDPAYQHHNCQPQNDNCVYIFPFSCMLHNNLLVLVNVFGRNLAKEDVFCQQEKHHPGKRPANTNALLTCRIASEVTLNCITPSMANTLQRSGCVQMTPQRRRHRNVLASAYRNVFG